MNKIYKISGWILTSLAVILVFTSITKSFFRDKITYVEASYVKIYEDIDTFGVFTKEETLVERSVQGYTDLSISSGDKVSKNQTIAQVYSDDSYVRLNKEILELENLLQILESLDNYTNLKTNLLINDNIVNFGETLDKNKVTDIYALTNELQLLLLKKSFSTMSQVEILNEIGSINTQIATKNQSLDKNQISVFSPETGYFIEGIDGFEGINEFSVDEILELENQRVEVEIDEEYLGKIVTDFNWYYMCVVSELEYQAIKDVKNIELIFDKLPTAVISVELFDYEMDNGFVMLTFKGSSHQNEIFKLRTSNAQIILDTHYGVSVPKEATRVLDGKIGVYTVSGSNQVFKLITKIYEGYDFFLIEQKKNPTSLDIIPGDKIIVGSKNLS